MSQILHGTGTFTGVAQRFDFAFSRLGGWTLKIDGIQSLEFWQSCCANRTSAVEFVGELPEFLLIRIPNCFPIGVGEFIAIQPPEWGVPFQIIKPYYAEDSLWAYFSRIITGYLPYFSVKNYRLKIDWRRSA
jgi:hypothetical protein